MSAVGSFPPCGVNITGQFTTIVVFVMVISPAVSAAFTSASERSVYGVVFWFHVMRSTCQSGLYSGSALFGPAGIGADGMMFACSLLVTT